VAALATALLVVLAPRLGRPDASSSTGHIDLDEPAPAIVGTTLDGAAFDLTSLLGRPVIINFWGPTCVPCRDEFPLLKSKLAEHAADDLAVVGILMYDAPAPARSFVAELGATWPTVDDPDGAIRRAYRVLARPQSYFIDADGVVRAVQVGAVESQRFEALYGTIRPGASHPPT